jgi:cysteine synthase A
LVPLSRVTDSAPATGLRKIEGRNPAYSVKMPNRSGDGLGSREARLLGSGKALIEPTSGNTGIALAFVATARNILLTLTMPDTMSLERRKLLIAYGAKLVLTEGARGTSRAITKAEEIVASAPDRYVLLQQFKHPANPGIREATTAEICDHTAGALDFFGSGRELAARSREVYAEIRDQGQRQIVSLTVEPSANPVHTQQRPGQLQYA